MVKNLVFDLGGVILDLAVNDTLQAFAKLSGLPQKRVQELFVVSKEFEYYEKGELNDQEFRDFVRALYEVSVRDEDIDRCWNAMLLGIPKAKLDLLQRLKEQYRVFLLSNTNPIHLEYINFRILPEAAGVNSLDNYFHKSYYSHFMGKRKPEASIFQQVLDENGLAAEETLFLDDNAGNVEGAKKVGLQTVHVTHPDLVLDYFNP